MNRVYDITRKFIFDTILSSSMDPNYQSEPEISGYFHIPNEASIYYERRGM